jgi:hypothetical protein
VGQTGFGSGPESFSCQDPNMKYVRYFFNWNFHSILLFKDLNSYVFLIFEEGIETSSRTS